MKPVHPELGTPNNIGVLLHYHCFADEHPRKDAPAVKDAIKLLLSHNLIERIPRKPFFTSTEKGAFHVKALCSLPLPVSKEAWRTPDQEMEESG